ncbi:hypothetical protein OESDEN_14928 [Oesophagostomum dentatum]|uniref:Uncharacterized protein n=1 Tax=Oesophagostomum dentatum TaxID=61180 RepID=A0A0B1SQ62_OESDE|nr:hypothetical protein OESDEN_14928 [Oesophagostomum dentatum]
MDPGSSFHTFTSTNTPKKKDEDVAKGGKTPKLTRLERANRAIEVMERRLKANKHVRERCGHLEEKLDQLNKDMDAAYIKIKDELTRAELGRTKGSTSSVSTSKTTSVYTTDYLEKSELTPATSIPPPRNILDPSLEQRLSCMERSLKRLDSIELALAKLTSRLDGPAARAAPAPKSGGNLYGCRDVSEVFSQVIG